MPRCIRWFRRFRKRCGYGIHSPFAFSLVTGVIYEKGEYYAYEHLEELRNCTNAFLRHKDDRLLFRLVNHAAPSNGVVICTQLGITKEYLREARKTADWHFMSPFSSQKPADVFRRLQQVDFIYIDDVYHTERILEAALPFVTDRTLLVVRNIHHNPALSKIWKIFIQHPQVRVTFDLYDFGLVYFERRLNKENYIINYF